MVVVVVVQLFLNSVLSPNIGGGQIYLILPEIVLSPNLNRFLASLSFSTTFLLCSTTAFSQVFTGQPFRLTLKTNAPLRKLFLSFLNTCPYQRTLLALAG